MGHIKIKRVKENRKTLMQQQQCKTQQQQLPKFIFAVSKGVSARNYYETLLKKGEDIDATDRMGQTALFWAVTVKRFDIFKILIDLKADSKVIDIKGVDLISWAKEQNGILPDGKPDENASTDKFVHLLERLKRV